MILQLWKKKKYKISILKVQYSEDDGDDVDDNDFDTCLQNESVVVNLQSVHSFSAQVLLHQNFSCIMYHASKKFHVSCHIVEGGFTCSICILLT